METRVKKLTKSRTDKTICGVCGGIAKYLDCDPTIVRLITVGLTVLYGIGIPIYIACALVMPFEDVEPENENAEE